MPDVPQISQAEWQVMKVIWDTHPITASDVIDALDGQKDWKPKTIKTLLNRLLNKGALGFDKKGKTYHYYPLFSEDQCVLSESESFLGRVFGGNLKPALAHFVENSELSDDEIDELKKMLDRKK